MSLENKHQSLLLKEDQALVP